MTQAFRLWAGALCIITLGPDPSANSEAQIVFASRRDGNWEIYTMDADGAHQQRLTRRGEQERFPLWSPDCRSHAGLSLDGPDWKHHHSGGGDPRLTS